MFWTILGLVLIAAAMVTVGLLPTKWTARLSWFVPLMAFMGMISVAIGVH